MLITGPTSGIGRQIAIELGGLGAHLILGCRNEAKGRDAARAIAANRHAGSVDVLWVPETELSRNLLPEVRQARARPGRTVAQAADTAVWLAASADVAGVTGRFYADRREQPCEFRDQDAEETLWRICEDFVNRTTR